MDHRPRSQSVLQIHSLALPSRASRILSNFKGRIRLLSRKSRDDHDTNNPYPSQSRSMDGFGGVKPYVSHPMLGNMIIEPYNPMNNDGLESCSPSSSPPRSESRQPEVSGSLPRGIHVQNGPQYTISTGLIPVARAGAVININSNQPSVDGLPVSLDSHSHSHPLLNPVQSTATASIFQPAAKHKTTPSIVISNPPNPPEYLQRQLSLEAKSAKSIVETPNNGLSPARILTRKPSRTRLNDKLDRSASAQPPLPDLPLMTAHDSSSTSSTLMLGAPPTGTAQTLSTRRDEPPPRLTLPPHSHRFSLTLSDGTAARLSPSVILRPPPLPIMNLPSLPPVSPPTTSTLPTQTRYNRSGLRNMPELPRMGTDRGNDDADEGEDEEGEGEEDEFDDEDVGPAQNGKAINHESFDENYPRPSMSSSIDSGGLYPSSSSTSHTKSHSRSSSYQETIFPVLPRPDTSRMDLSFLDNPPPSSYLPDRKGKGKAKSGQDDVSGEESNSEEQDRTRTPTSVTPYRDYFNSQAPRGISSFYGASHNRDGVHPREDGFNASPIRTPRPDDPLRAILPIPRPRPMHTPDVLISSPSTTRPSMYKHASRSLIDIHALEKQERVEQMIREEQAIEEEKRRSVLISQGKKRQSVLDPVGEAEHDRAENDKSDARPATGEQTLQKRISMAPPYESVVHALRRRRSMPTFTAASPPPPYPAFAPFAHPMSAHVQIQPRDDEGRERLPPYSNSIYMRALLPRKMEFVAAGVQAKDRKWRRVLCILEGTALKVYRPPGATGVSAIGEWWERKVGVGDTTYSGPSNSVGGTNMTSRDATSSGEATERVPKVGKEREGPGQTELVLTPQRNSPSPTTPVTPTRSQFPTQQPAATRSRLNLAVGLLRPSRPHGRSISDAPNPPPAPARSPRPSLNILRSSPGRSRESESRPDSSLSRHLDSPTNGAPSVITSDHSMMYTVASPSSSSQNSVSASSAMDGSTRAARSAEPEPEPADLIRVYTMQHAESGLGNDYIKRKNVIRVRVEGEQFLLQAKNLTDVVAWIEALQAAANIALDLDERIMPKGPLFPRRRRRGRPRQGGTDTIGESISGTPVVHTNAN